MALVRIETRATQAGTAVLEISQDIAAIWMDIQRNPSVNTRENNACVSKTTFNRNNLNVHPYRVHTQASS